jgi:H+/Cl- antiporter ClcA
MCFSVSSGLPLGKEGPMIHTGSIVGAAVSQGKTITFGFDTSWTKFQDLRNDRTKRDFVTFGAAAGVASAFKAPVGGILFTLEEGASFWSTSHTFRSFFCAMMTILTISLIFAGNQIGDPVSVGVQFGIFDTANFRTYELIIFALMGVGGGILGSFFNLINRRVNQYRQNKLTTWWQNMLELLLITSLFSFVSFILPLCWQVCTPKPTATATYTTQEYELLSQLVQFQCNDNEYNQVASLFMTNSDSAMQLLYHYVSPNGNDYTTFTTGSLLVFFIPYFFMAAITSGTIVPAGLFVPTLMSGAAYGRLIGNILNLAFPGNVASAGLYSLMGAAAVLGGVSRMTIAGAVIVIEACGSTSYLLPLMITFAAARYSGNAINDPIYEMLIRLKVRHLNKHIFITTIIITLIDLWSCIIQGITILRRLSQDTRIIKLSSDS